MSTLSQIDTLILSEMSYFVQKFPTNLEESHQDFIKTEYISKYRLY